MNEQPQVEEAKTVYYPPKGKFMTFENEEEYAEKGREWGLFNKQIKEEFWYKEKEYKRRVQIKGYEVHGKHNTLVIEFLDGNLSCIHPAYLKEMQSPTFGKEMTDDEWVEENQIEKPKKEKPKKESTAEKPKKETKPKETKEKITLPNDKVHFHAKVENFATKYNPFTESDDEVILFSHVTIVEPTLTVGTAWCSYSKTLKKYELKEGDELTFDGKIAEKKFDKEILYKINNPSKIDKKENA